MVPFWITIILLIQICFSDFKNLGRFWHVTDLHIDDRYSVNGNPELMCWEAGTNVTGSNNQLGKFGHFKCDSPQSLIESALKAMRDILPQPDFVVWTGDDKTHVNDSFFSTEIVVRIVANLTSQIKKTFPDTPVFPVLGNHDVFPKDQIGSGQSRLQTDVANLWKEWLDTFGVYSEFLENGRFLANLNGSKISVMGLNTLLWYERNQVTKNDPQAIDPGDQFTWMDLQLKSLKGRGRKVYLIGHIPPGLSAAYIKSVGYQPRYNDQYIKLIQKYGPSTIAGQFFGHIHYDGFRVFLEKHGDKETPVSFALIAPSVTPWSSSNPGLRLITYDRDTAEVVESSTYYLDLKKANEINEAVWAHEYNLTKILGINTINAESLFEAAQKMKSDSKLFNLYYPVTSVQAGEASSCPDACRRTHICAITNFDHTEYNACYSHAARIPASTAAILCIASMVLMLSKK